MTLNLNPADFEERLRFALLAVPIGEVQLPLPRAGCRIYWVCPPPGDRFKQLLNLLANGTWTADTMTLVCALGMQILNADGSLLGLQVSDLDLALRMSEIANGFQRQQCRYTLLRVQEPFTLHS